MIKAAGPTGIAVLAMIFLSSTIPVEAALIQHLDATESGSVTGSPVTNWVDQSPGGNDAVPAEGDVYYPSPSVSATGEQGLDFGAVANSLELFSVAESDAWLNFSGTASTNSGFAILAAFKVDVLNDTWMDVLGNSSTIRTGFVLRLGADGSMKTRGAMCSTLHRSLAASTSSYAP